MGLNFAGRQHEITPITEQGSCRDWPHFYPDFLRRTAGLHNAPWTSGPGRTHDAGRLIWIKPPVCAKRIMYISIL